MRPTAPMSTASAISVPDIDIDEPVVVIPAASVAPLDGPPDGERINAFLVMPRTGDAAFEESSADVLGTLRASVLRKPLTYAAAAFALGFLISRTRR